MITSKKYLLPFILVTSLFFLWAFLHNINPALIPHLKKACELSDTQSAFVDTSIYLAYFSIALPAGWFMHRLGYKKAILIGLFLFGAGFFLFIPAASSREYWFFLAALFIGGAGATFLETAANPYITKLGDEANGTQRLNFAQSFNGMGAFIAPLIGSKFILSGIDYSKQQLDAMAPAVRAAYLQSEADTVKMPYLVLGLVVLLVFIFFLFTKLPNIHEQDEQQQARFSFRVFRHRHFTWAVIAQFFYVGAQTCMGSFFARFSGFTAGISDKDATYLWGSVAMVGFMVGRFSGTFLMRYIKPARLLALYALICVALVATGVMASGKIAVYAFIGVPFFMSIMFPTIFSLGIAGLGEETKIASSFLVMSIVGGAIIPPLLGKISDNTQNIQTAYIVPLLCFAIIALFGITFRKKATALTPSTH